MRFVPDHCPTCKSSEHLHSVETIIGHADLTRNDDGTFEYSGSTDVIWDSQTNICETPGTYMLYCWQCGKDFPAAMSEDPAKTPCDYLDEIAALFDGLEWGSGRDDGVVAILTRSGRVIREAGEVCECGGDKNPRDELCSRCEEQERYQTSSDPLAPLGLRPDVHDDEVPDCSGCGAVLCICPSTRIFEQVVEAMQPAEELSGPEGGDYIALMFRIEEEARTRRATYERNTLEGGVK